VDFLEEYETWMKQERTEKGKTIKGNSETTIGMYLRNLRSIMNMALEENKITRDKYPFGKKRYNIPVGSSQKKFLTEEELDSIIEYKTEDKTLQEARDYFLFSYFANGMNPKDIARLKHSDFSDDIFTFVRSKTARTTKGQRTKITVILVDELIEIIKKRGTGNKGYVFPILDKLERSRRTTGDSVSFPSFSASTN
jgi:integrase/recombinase XerD